MPFSCFHPLKCENLLCFLLINSIYFFNNLEVWTVCDCTVKVSLWNLGNRDGTPHFFFLNFYKSNNQSIVAENNQQINP